MLNMLDMLDFPQELNALTLLRRYTNFILPILSSQIDCLELPTAMRLQKALEKFWSTAKCDLSLLAPEEHQVLQILGVSQNQFNDFMEETQNYFATDLVDELVEFDENLEYMNLKALGIRSYLDLLEHYRKETLSNVGDSLINKLKHYITGKEQVRGVAAVSAQTAEYTPMRQAALAASGRAEDVPQVLQGSARRRPR